MFRIFHLIAKHLSSSRLDLWSWNDKQTLINKSFKIFNIEFRVEENSFRRSIELPLYLEVLLILPRFGDIRSASVEFVKRF